MVLLKINPGSDTNSAVFQIDSLHPGVTCRLRMTEMYASETVTTAYATMKGAELDKLISALQRARAQLLPGTGTIRNDGKLP